MVNTELTQVWCRSVTCKSAGAQSEASMTNNLILEPPGQCKHAPHPICWFKLKYKNKNFVLMFVSPYNFLPNRQNKRLIQTSSAINHHYQLGNGYHDGSSVARIFVSPPSFWELHLNLQAQLKARREWQKIIATKEEDSYGRLLV